MATIKGSDVVLKKGDGGGPEVFTAIAAARTVNWSINGQERDITTAQDVAGGGTWRVYAEGINDFEATVSGLVKDKTSFNALIADRIAGTVANYELLITDFGTFAGAMIITSISGTGQFDETATYDISVRANGAITYTAA